MNFFAKLSSKKSAKSNKKVTTTQDIENHLKEQEREQQKTIQILLLGAGGSGKSTVIKQMDRIYNKDSNGQHSMQYMEDMLQLIHKNIVLDVYELCKHFLTLRSQNAIELNDSFDTELEEIIFRLSSELHAITAYALTISLATDIEKLWANDIFKQVFYIRQKSHVMDNSPYFLDNVQTFASLDYVPTFEDYIRIRNQTTGINRQEFTVEQHGQEFIFTVIDVGGQRAERRKWMKVFDGIQVVLYVMSLAAYDQYLYEDNRQRCWDETFELFEQTINHKCFAKTDFIVFLNKNDLFERKIKDVSFMNYIRGKNSGNTNNNTNSMHLNHGKASPRIPTQTPSFNQFMPSGSGSGSTSASASASASASRKRVSQSIPSQSQSQYRSQTSARHSQSHSQLQAQSQMLPNKTGSSSVSGRESDSVTTGVHFKESDGHSSQAVLKWVHNRFLQLFYKSHGGEETYNQQRLNLRRCHFHVTCATDNTQIETVVEVIQRQMLRRALSKIGY